MRALYLIRHASPNVQPQVRAADWTLSERGIEEAQRLAETARSWGLRTLYTSTEAKARATALIVGEACGVGAAAVQGLEELRFDEWIGNADAFSDAVKSILEHPQAVVRGAERASSAADRFAAAMRIIEQGELPAAVVSHGRILTAYLSGLLHLDDPFALWRSIPMPGWALLDLDGPRLVGEFRGLPA
jgi:broad specificity phosphatase PhoE